MWNVVAWAARRPVVTLFLLAAGAGAVWAFVLLRLPPPPDWRSAHAHAIEAGNCARAYTIAVTASGAGVPGGYDFWRETYAARYIAGQVPLCAPSWEALFGAPEAPDELVAEAIADLVAHGSAAAPERPVLAVGRWATGWAALNGFWVEPSYGGEGASYSPDFMGLSLADRFLAAWAVIKCDPVRGSGRPDWQMLDAWVNYDPNSAVRKGAWQRVAEECARSVLSLVDSIGIDAEGPKARALETMLHYARALPRGNYLYAARLLVHGKLPWFVDAQDKAQVADQYRSMFDTFGMGLWNTHGPSLVLYARKILDGTEPRYLQERRWDVARSGDPLTDDQYAYALLMVAVEEGEPVVSERDAVAARLSRDARAAAVAWAYRYFGEQTDGEGRGLARAKDARSDRDGG